MDCFVSAASLAADVRIINSFVQWRKFSSHSFHCDDEKPLHEYKISIGIVVAVVVIVAVVVVVVVVAVVVGVFVVVNVVVNVVAAAFCVVNV